MLDNCASCREFYGQFNPAANLRRLMKMGVFIVSDFMPVGVPKRNMDMDPISETAAAVTIDFSGRQEGTFYKPCVYVNPKKFLVANETPGTSSGLEGLTLAQARGVAILHELAHIANVIPSDGSKGLDAEQSVKNTICIRKKCFACDGSRQPCSTIASHSNTNQVIHALLLDRKLNLDELGLINLVRQSISKPRDGP